jgi:hypothetical protein
MNDQQLETNGTNAAAGERATVEHWAERKGLVPAFHPGRPAQRNRNVLIPGTRPRENPNHWKLRAARALRGWVEGAEVTEAEFDAAIAEASGVVSR